MDENTVSLSTRQASDLLGVHESSVKRWCNAEELACWLTPGGHRRIPVVSLVDFAREQGMALSLEAFGDEAGEVWAGRERAERADDFEGLVDLTYAWIAEGESRAPVHLIQYLVQEGFSYEQLFDRLVGPVMHRVGVGYLEGRLSIGDEHRMTQALRDALIALRPPNDRVPPSNGHAPPTAIVGCARGEVHELGALMVRLLLENEGWRVIYLGLDVPTEEFAAQQVTYGASLVCIAMMPPKGLPDAQAIVHVLGRMADPARPFRLALGSSAFAAADSLAGGDAPHLPVELFSTMEPFARWVRTLTP